jgi:hypothetical protein
MKGIQSYSFASIMATKLSVAQFEPEMWGRVIA